MNPHTRPAGAGSKKKARIGIRTMPRIDKDNWDRYGDRNSKTYVATPPEVSDFIIESVKDLVRENFGQELDESNVTILDPFVGAAEMLDRLNAKKANVYGVEIVRDRAVEAKKILGDRVKVIWADTLEEIKPDTDIEKMYRDQQGGPDKI